MSYIASEEVAKAKQVDLLTYLQARDPNELVRLNSNTYCTREHDSLKISNGLWYWWSRGFGGKSALDYLIKVKGFSFTEAVEKILNGDFQRSVLPVLPTKDLTPKVFKLPKAYSNNNRVINYLISRGIHKSIIDYCINEGKLYEEAKYHNAVFVGYDKKGIPKYGTMRGTIGTYHGDVNNSDKSCSFSYSSKDSSTLYVFEAAIDLLSFATMKLYSFGEWRNDNYL